MANVIGPDVSFYQDDPQTPQGIDFAKLRANAGYVVIRAGQNLWADRDFKLNWREAKSVGLPRGSYWFYDSRADPKHRHDVRDPLHRRTPTASASAAVSRPAATMSQEVRSRAVTLMLPS